MVSPGVKGLQTCGGKCQDIHGQPPRKSREALLLGGRVEVINLGDQM